MRSSGKVKITIRISRYRAEKRLGELYRLDSNAGETFTSFRKRMKQEKKKKKKSNR